MFKKAFLYRTERGDVSLSFDEGQNTVWTTKNEMRTMFGRDLSVIQRHVGNILESGELDRESSIRVLPRTVRGADGIVRTRDVEHFNMDMVISVGYRVNSIESTRFRKWATSVLTDYAVKGIAVNVQRLAERRMGDLVRLVEMAQTTFSSYWDRVEADKGVLNIIKTYGKTWKTLAAYDSGELRITEKRNPATVGLDPERMMQSVTEFRRELSETEPNLGMFGSERDGGFRRIVASLEQSMFGSTLYPSVEEKAANLLYFIVKDHPFSDGNKRIASYLFLDYLQKEGFPLPDPETVTATTLLAAGSAPEDRDTVIGLVASIIPERPEGPSLDTAEEALWGEEETPEDPDEDEGMTPG